MQVAEVMQRKVWFCHEGSSLNWAAELMWNHRVGALPVVDFNLRPVAMITDRDIAMAAYTQGQKLDHILVSSAMSRAVTVVNACDSVLSAEELMSAYSLRRLPVVNDLGNLVGILCEEQEQIRKARDRGRTQGLEAAVPLLVKAPPARPEHVVGEGQVGHMEAGAEDQ